MTTPNSGDGGQGDGGQQQQQQQAAGGQGDGGQQETLYRPNGMPDHLYGGTNAETIDKLFTENKGFRDAQATMPKAPESADAYAFNWTDRVKGYGAIADDDAVLGKFREIAHEHGYTQGQIDAIPKIFDFMAEKGMIDQPFDSSKLLKDLAPADFKGSPEEIEAKGGERLTAAENFIKQLTPAQGYSDDMKTELRLLTTTPAGIKVIEQLRNSGMRTSVSTGGEAQQLNFTKAELDQRTSDPRNDAFGDKYDPNFAAQTREMFKQMFPDGRQE